MQHFSKMVTLLGLMTFAFFANAEELKLYKNPSKLHPELSVIQKCFLKDFDAGKYNEAIAAGKSHDDAMSAGWSKSFDLTIYNQAIAAGKSNPTATMLATGYVYIDQSPECDHVREDVKDLIVKFQNLK